MQVLHGSLLLKASAAAGESEPLHATTFPLALREAAFVELAACLLDLLPDTQVMLLHCNIPFLYKTRVAMLFAYAWLYRLF